MLSAGRAPRGVCDTRRVGTPIGVVGLGRMGLGLALRLVDEGFTVVATSRSQPTRDAAAAQGLDVLPDAGSVAGRVCDLARAEGTTPVVLTSLPDAPQVRQVGGDVLAVTGGDRLVLVDTSTIAPNAARELGEEFAGSGGRLVDAPVSGGPGAARDGTLSVMAGGDADDVETARPVLDAIGARVVVCGGLGAGQVAKLCNQMLVMTGLTSVAEVLVLADRLGADAARVREAMLGGYAASRILELHGERMLARDFEARGAVSLHEKDIATMRELAAGRVPLAVAEAAARIIEELYANDGRDLDQAGVITQVERRAAGAEASAER